MLRVARDNVVVGTLTDGLLIRRRIILGYDEFVQSREGVVGPFLVVV